MNIDARRSNRIQNSPKPFGDMIDSLEDFSDRIGGLAWRQHRARNVIFTRAIVLYLDEDSEHLKRSINPKKNKLLLDGEGMGEQIEVKFEASRVRGDRTTDDFESMYEISFSHSLPLNTLDDVLPEYLERVEAEITDESALPLAESTLTPIGKPKQFSISEHRTTTYTIDPNDSTLRYGYEISYVGSDFTIDGPSFWSDALEYEDVHPTSEVAVEEYAPDLGNMTEEEVERAVNELASTSLEDQVRFNAYLSALSQRTNEADALNFGDMTPEDVERVTSQLSHTTIEDEVSFYAHLLALERSKREEDAIEVVGLSPRQHAIRIMSLLSILKSGLYVRPIDRPTDR
jgi:hypothetical protein